jgi:Secretion system C-terminal sorting domain
MIGMKTKKIRFTTLVFFLFTQYNTIAQNIFSGEPVQVVGAFNGYSTTPYGSDYRTSAYRRVSANTGTPVDGRGQWHTKINVQNSGGDIMPINMAGGAGNGFLFITGPAGSRFQNKWVFSNIGQGAVNSVNNITAYNSGEDMGLNLSTTGYYTFNFNDCGYTIANAVYFVGYTSAAPVSIIRSSEISNPNGSLKVGITSSASLSAQENIFIRYTTGIDFAGAGTSSLVQASGSSTSYTATIPTFANGTVVRYYIFTSTQTLAQLTTATETNKTLAVINFDDNAGNNYLHTTVVLSVNLLSFTGKAIATNNILQWITSEEINIDYYEIMRASDGINFKNIGKVISNNMLNTNIYELIDKDPLNNTNFYRLTTIEKDGTIKYSPIVRINGLTKNNQLTIFPNPVQEKINIAIPFSKKGSYRIDILNAIGQIISTQNYLYNGANTKLSLPLPSTCQKGKYILILTDENNIYKGEFLVN